MIDDQEKEQLRSAMERKRGEFLELFQRIFSHSFSKETKMILFHAEFYKYGMGYSVKTHEDVYEETPLKYDDQGNPVYDDFDSGSIDFLDALDLKEIWLKEDLGKYLNEAKKLFAQWLHDRWMEAGGERTSLKFVLTFADDYPDYYDLKKLEYHEE